MRVAFRKDLCPKVSTISVIFFTRFPADLHLHLGRRTSLNQKTKAKAGIILFCFLGGGKNKEKEEKVIEIIPHSLL